MIIIIIIIIIQAKNTHSAALEEDESTREQRRMTYCLCSKSQCQFQCHTTNCSEQMSKRVKYKVQC